MVGRANAFPSKLLIVFSLVLVATWSVFAGSTGQIKGRLTDKETKEPIVGATVQVVGTKMGGYTDADGNFLIRNVEPGIYVVKISSLEYNTLEVQKVEVKADLSAEISEKLTKKITELDKVITIEGTRDVIDKFEVSGTTSINKEQIASRPVTSVDDLLTTVAGVKTNAAGDVFIRGGRAGEVSYIVDGVPIGDKVGGSSLGTNLSLTSGSIQEIQIIKDGFDAEYGNALSGIVNIRSQTGNKDNTSLNVQYITDDFGNADLNKYSRNQDFLRVTLSGPDPILTTKILPALGINFLQDKEFTYYLYGEADKSDGIFQYEDYDTPFTRRQYSSFSLFGLDIPERLRNYYNVQFNVRFRPRQNLKFISSYKLWDARITRFSWDYRFSPNTANVASEKRKSLSFEVTHELARNFNYEGIISYLETDFREGPGDPNHPGEILNPDQMFDQDSWEVYNDVNRNGFYDPPEPIINIFPDTSVHGNVTVPGYTIGENPPLTNVQAGGGQTFANFRFNNNGRIDSIQSELFVDINGNGVWDAGDDFIDKNGNGILDQNRRALAYNPVAEPFIDGDSVIGEPFFDLNANGRYEPGIDVFVKAPKGDPENQDLNKDGLYNGPESPWSPGIPYYDRNGNGVYDLGNNQYDFGEPFTDKNGNGIHDQGGSAYFRDPNTYSSATQWKHTVTQTYRGELKVFKVIGQHELKGGFSLERTKFNYGAIDDPYTVFIGAPDSVGGQPTPYQGRGTFRDFFAYDPWAGAVYFRDKLEYGSMIASLGLRLDFFLQDTRDLSDALRQDDRGGLIRGDRHEISPRIGFAYPISDKAKVYFNYGHFFQLPTYDRFYARNSASVDQDAVLGNPDLDYQKTIQYSFGVKYAMSDNYSIDFQGYFKDEFDKINQFKDNSVIPSRNIYENSDYGRSRGVEVTIDKIGGGNVSGQLSYTYAFAYGKASQTNSSYLEDFELSRTPLDEAPLDNDIRHSLKSIVTVYVSNTEKPRLFGIPIFNGWTLTLQSIIETGKPFTPDGVYPGLDQSGLTSVARNSLRYPTIVDFEFRFAKEFRIGGIDFEGIFEMKNVFNNRNVNSIYSKTGRADTDQNIGGVVFGGTEYDNNPANYQAGRQVQLGLEMTL